LRPIDHNQAIVTTQKNIIGVEIKVHDSWLKSNGGSVFFQPIDDW
jgi:hypothetical protein